MTSPSENPRLHILRDSLHAAYRANPFLARHHPDITNGGLSVIDDTMQEIADILPIPIPPVEFFYGDGTAFAEVKGTKATNSLRLRIELGYFLEHAYALQEVDTSAAAIQHIKETLGEEMYHVYTATHFPRTDAVTQMANEAGGIHYLKDRGERIAKAFGRRYASGTLPSRWLSRRKA